MSRKIEDKIPAYYYPQVQMQMECCDLDVCDFVQYSPFGHRNTDEILMITEVKRDRDWWDKCFPLFESFHNEVQEYKRSPPQPLLI